MLFFGMQSFPAPLQILLDETITCQNVLYITCWSLGFIVQLEPVAYFSSKEASWKWNVIKRYAEKLLKMCLLALVGYCYLSIYCHVGWFIEAFSSGFHRDPDSKVNAGKAGVCVFVDTHTQTHRHRVKYLIFSTQGVLLEASHGDTADCVTVKVISHSTVWVQGKSVAPCRSLCKNPMNLPSHILHYHLRLSSYSSCYSFPSPFFASASLLCLLWVLSHIWLGFVCMHVCFKWWAARNHHYDDQNN